MICAEAPVATVDSLFNDNLSLPSFVLHRQFPNLAFDDDFIQTARIGLWKASKRFDPEAGTKFSTYAVILIRNEILQELRTRRRKSVPTVSLEQELGDDGCTYANLLPDQSESGAGCVEVFELIERLPDREKMAVTLTVYGKKQIEGAAIMSVSQAHFSRILNRARKILETGLE